MSAVVIKYSTVERAADHAQKASKRMTSYTHDMDGTIRSLSNLPGTDDAGYVSTALSLARTKRDNAEREAKRYHKLSDSLKSFVKYAKAQDKNAAESISLTVSSYVGERSFWQKIGDAIYDGYVNFLDHVESLGPFGKALAQAIREGVTAVGNWKRKISNWFKYGDGKYIWNIIDGVKDIILAIGAVALAIAAIVTGPVWLVVVGVLGVIFTTIWAIQQITDQCVKIDQNAKAWSLSGYKTEYGDGNPTAARYYGDIGGVEDVINKYDHGGAAENAAMNAFAEIYGKAKTFNKVVGSTCTLVATVGAGGLTEGADGSQVFSLKRGLKSYFFKSARDSGALSNAYQTGGYDVGKGANIFSKIFNHKYTKTFTKLSGGEKATIITIIGGAFDLTKTFSTLEKVHGGIEYFHNGGGSGYESVEKFMDIAKNVPAFDAWTGDGWSLVDGGKKLFTETFFPAHKGPNGYLQYVAEHPTSFGAVNFGGVR